MPPGWAGIAKHHVVAGFDTRTDRCTIDSAASQLGDNSDASQRDERCGKAAKSRSPIRVDYFLESIDRYVTLMCHLDRLFGWLFGLTRRLMSAFLRFPLGIHNLTITR